MYPFLVDERERNRLNAIATMPVFRDIPKDWQNEGSNHTYDQNLMIGTLNRSPDEELAIPLIKDYIKGCIDNEKQGIERSHMVLTLHRVEKTGDLYLYFKTIPTPF